MSEQAIIKSQQQSAVTPWASRQDVRELEERLKTMLPGAQKLNTMELTGLAQAAVAHNLDPFNGELWCIPGKGLMAGVKGHRRAAHRQINEEGNGNGNYYVEFSQIPIDEMTALKIPQKALAFRCRLHDSQTTRAYVESIERMLKAGMPWEVVSKIMGERPYTEGVGYYIDGEATKMTPVQCAQKRAEADALKRRFDLPFTMAIGVNGDSDVIDAEFTINEPERDPAEVQSKMRAASKTLRGDQGDIELGPDWTDCGNEHSETVKAISQEPTKTAAPPKQAVNKSTAFFEWCKKWIAEHPDYADTTGKRPNMFHILGRVAKLGFAEITDGNKDDVIAMLDSYVKGKVDSVPV